MLVPTTVTLDAAIKSGRRKRTRAGSLYKRVELAIPYKELHRLVA